MSANKAQTNPYLSARLEWNERYGSYVQSARTWQIIGLVAVGFAMATTSVALWQSSTTRVVPYVVEVDKLGAIRGGGVAKIGTYEPERVVRATLAEFVRNWREVCVDGWLQKARIDALYQHVSRNDPALHKLSKHFRDDGFDPFELAREKTIGVEINAINRLTEHSFQIDWTETDYDRTGHAQPARLMRATLHIRFSPSTDELSVEQNPLGLYVTDLNWTEIVP